MQEPATTVNSVDPEQPQPGAVINQSAQGKKMKFAYASGSKPLDGYTVKRGIGIGGFGEVYFATSDAGKEVALKKIQRNLDIELRGVRQCLNLKHANLIALWDIRYDEDGEAWVIMEYVAGESLRDVIHRNPNGMPTEKVDRWFQEIASGVSYLHDHGIVHRDLKPGNIFMDEDVVKIGDYGLSKFISTGQRSGQTENVGTFHYMAPEIGKGVYGKEIDIYALGILLFEMLTGDVPFEGESSQEIIMKHLTASPELEGIKDPYRRVIDRALLKDPEHRYNNVQEMLADLAGESIPESNQPADVAADAIPKPRPARDEPLVIGPDAESDTLFISDDDDERQGIALGEVRQSNVPRPTPNPVRQQPRPSQPLPPRAGADQKNKRPQQRRRRPRLKEVLYRHIGTRPQSDRLAELTSSFMSSAIVCGVVCLLVLSFASDQFENAIRWWSFFTWMTVTSIAGAWLVLAAGKVWEGADGDHVHRRFVMLVVGLVLAGFSFACSDFALATTWPEHTPAYFKSFYESGVPTLPAYLMFFGTLFVAIRWWKQTDPLRDSRFSLTDTTVIGLAAFLFYVLWQFPPWAIAVAISISIGVQLASPWLSFKQRHKIYDQLQEV